MSAPQPQPQALPPLPFWQARSFWAQVLMVLAVLCRARGGDLDLWLAGLGLPDRAAAIDLALVLAPPVFGLWAWLERRAPRYRLSWRGVRAAPDRPG